jgi:predicted glycogen debranching enzyme
MIRFDHATCADLERAQRLEWLETNGLGGFSSSTITGLNTRRYHGLLVAATRPPVGRMVLLSKLEETLVIDGHPLDLSVNRYPGVVHPQGFRCLKQFRLDPFPIFTYEVNGVAVEKSVFMIQGENTVVVQYQLLRSPAAVRSLGLFLRPLIAFRDYHSTTHENGALNGSVGQEPGLAALAPYPGLPTLYLAHNALDLQPSGDWYRNFEYDAERERGLDYQEDLFCPLLFRFDLDASKAASILASTEPHDVARAAEYRAAEIARRKSLREGAPAADDFTRALAVAADQYLVARGNLKTVIAGYHWFSDWGRDTMISLPGLALATGKYDVARDILREFAQTVNQGMLPNRFPDSGGPPEYNTVDATLWFFEAARAYLACTGDREFLRDELYSVFRNIVAWHVRGTRYGIKVDPGGLLASGEPGVQLTWMDAKVGDWVVTPRRGRPVEIQALWYNALRILESLAHSFEDAPAQNLYGTMATLAQWSFNRLFWNEKADCLYDGIDENGIPDASIRPNQIFAVSLPHSMLSPDRAKRVVAKVQHALLTPYGLRSLAPDDPQYHGHYTGDQASRDRAYHQGTVWPWLLGPFLTAYLKVNDHTAAARDQVAEWLKHIETHLADAGLGHISEIFEGDPPHRPAGCIAQAWSVAEILRACVQHVTGTRPAAGREAAAAATLPAGRPSMPATPGPKTNMTPSSSASTTP